MQPARIGSLPTHLAPSVTISTLCVSDDEPARATWADERLDDLSRSIERINAQGADTSRRFVSLEARIGVLQRTMIQVGSAMTVAILATLLSVILPRA